MQILKLLKAILGFLGCVAIACFFGAAASGVSLQITLALLGGGVLLLAPAALSSESVRAEPDDPAKTREKRGKALSLSLIGVGTVLYLAPYFAWRGGSPLLESNTTIWLLSGASVLIGSGIVVDKLVRRGRQGPPA